MAIELIKEFDFLFFFREDRGVLREAFTRKNESYPFLDISGLARACLPARVS
jgi:hypothetical protein